MRIIRQAAAIRRAFKRGGWFYGEVPVSELITGNALASAIGLTAGTAQHSNEPWLHFELDGKTLYVAKKTYRFYISWNHIQAVNAVYGSRTIVINGKTYKVRLLKGSATDPYVGGNGYDPVGAYGSEWNRLIYSVHNGVHSRAGNVTPPGTWPLYSDTDLLIDNTVGDGSFSWCQETSASDSTLRVRRGSGGLTFLGLNRASEFSTYSGWRPVLELVE